MTILGQIREEASKIADTMVLEVIDMASKNLTRSRFARLRKNKTYATTEQEAAYLFALHKYVYYKLAIRKQIHFYDKRENSYWQYKSEMERWRNEMDRIERLNPYSTNLFTGQGGRSFPRPYPSLTRSTNK